MARGLLVSLAFAVAASTAGATTAATTAPLTVSITGNGVVRVSGHPPIGCKSTCSETLRVRVGTAVTLAAQPAAGWKQSPWSGACDVKTAICKVHVLHGTRAAVTFYRPRYSCTPPPPTVPDGQVFSGTTISRNLCMTIAANDVGDLMLTAEAPTSGQLWFNLR